MEQGNGAPTWPNEVASTSRIGLTGATIKREACEEPDGVLTCAPVSRHRESAARSALRLAVTLKDETAHGGSEEGQHSGGDGCWGSQDEPQVTSKTGLKHK